jgi:transcriptional regulator with XRE-family HTH domain
MRSVYTDDYRSVLKVLIAARAEAGLSQQQVAERLGKPQSFISKYEGGERRLDVGEFVAIVRALDADPVKLMRRIVQGPLVHATNASPTLARRSAKKRR